MDISYFTRRMRRVFCITVSPLFLSASALDSDIPPKMPPAKKLPVFKQKKPHPVPDTYFFARMGKKRAFLPIRRMRTHPLSLCRRAFFSAAYAPSFRTSAAFFAQQNPIVLQRRVRRTCPQRTFMRFVRIISSRRQGAAFPAHASRFFAQNRNIPRQKRIAPQRFFPARRFVTQKRFSGSFVTQAKKKNAAPHMLCDAAHDAVSFCRLRQWALHRAAASRRA